MHHHHRQVNFKSDAMFDNNMNLWVFTLESSRASSPLGSLKNFERNLFLAGPSSASPWERSWACCSPSDSSPLPPDLSTNTSSLPCERRRMSERLEEGERPGEWGLLAGQERSKGCIWTSTIFYPFLSLSCSCYRITNPSSLYLTSCVTASDASEPLSLAGHRAQASTQEHYCRATTAPALELSRFAEYQEAGLSSSCTEVKNLWRCSDGPSGPPSTGTLLIILSFFHSQQQQQQQQQQQ